MKKILFLLGSGFVWVTLASAAECCSEKTHCNGH